MLADSKDAAIANAWQQELQNGQPALKSTGPRLASQAGRAAPSAEQNRLNRAFHPAARRCGPISNS